MPDRPSDMVRVLEGVLKPPVLESSELDRIEFYDREGTRHSLMQPPVSGFKWRIRHNLMRGGAKPGLPGRVRIYAGGDETPCLESAEVTLIEFYRPGTGLYSIVHRVFDRDTWALCWQGDPDWYESLVRMGYAEGKPLEEDILKG